MVQPNLAIALSRRLYYRGSIVRTNTATNLASANCVGVYAMELLELLKRAHRQVLGRLERVTAATDGQTEIDLLRSLIKEQLRIERDYIFAEVNDGSRAATHTLKVLESQQNAILERLAEVASGDSVLGEAESLRALLVKYFESVGDRLLPLVRQSLTTAEREELAQVVSDVLEETVFMTDMVAAV